MRIFAVVFVVSLCAGFVAIWFLRPLMSSVPTTPAQSLDGGGARSLISTQHVSEIPELTLPSRRFSIVHRIEFAVP
jgi:hypothetical protein